LEILAKVKNRTEEKWDLYIVHPLLPAMNGRHVAIHYKPREVKYLLH
jgi:hypothetical protein